MAKSEFLFDEEHVAARPMTGPSGKQIGWGLFARRAIAPGETVLELDLSDERRVEVLSWDDVEDEQHNRCVAIAPRWYFYVSKQSPLWFLNHSCDPSAAFKDWMLPVGDVRMPLAALRPIAPGEQVTFDYSLTITSDDGLTDDDEYSMDCLCGEPNCRKTLKSFVRLPRELQRKELLRRTPFSGTIPAFVLNEAPELVAELKKSAPAEYEVFQKALAAQLKMAAKFEDEYDPDEPYFLVEGEPQ